VTGNVTLYPTASDKAGNVVNLPTTLIHIDLDDPSIVAKVDPGASPDVWTPGPVTVTFEGSDGFSGVASVKYTEGAEVLAIDGGGQIVTGEVTDLAGNTSDYTVEHINIDGTLPTPTILLVDQEGVVGANLLDPVPTTVDLKAKLDAFGMYDPDAVALGYAFENAAGEPVAGLKVYATVLAVGADGVIREIRSFRFCEFAPTGGFYYFVLPAGLVSGQVYEIWFEEPTGAHTFKTHVLIP